MHSGPAIIEFGESAFLVSFDPDISEQTNSHVHALDALVRKAGDGYITFTIPAYSSLTVGFTPSGDPNYVRSIIKDALTALTDTTESRESVVVEIPVCYHEAFAPDMSHLCEQTGLAREQIISTLCRNTYRVYMIGFVAGFPYMGKLPDRLWCPRHATPRPHVPRGSVAIAETQLGVYPTDSPGGWNIIGRTPLPLVQPSSPEPFLFHPGESVKLVEVSLSEYRKLELVNS